MAKHPWNKSAKSGKPHVTVTDGAWKWHVLKTYGDPRKEYARVFCDVEGFCREMGDVYVTDLGDVDAFLEAYDAAAAK